MMSSPRLRRLTGTALGVAGTLAAVLLVTGEHSEESGSARASGESAQVSAHPVTDLRPPPVTVLHRSAGLAPGLIFLGAKQLSQRPGEQGGPLIVDDHGRPSLDALLRTGCREDQRALEPVDGTGDRFALIPDEFRQVGGATWALLDEGLDNRALERRELCRLFPGRAECGQNPQGDER